MPRSLATIPKIFLALTCAVSLLNASSGSFAAGTYKEAVQEYNSGQYARAASSFSALKAAYPTNTLVRYYLALSEQALMHVAQAKTEFEWVAENGDGRMKAMAEAGLSQLSHAHTSYKGSGTPIATIASAATASTSAPANSKVKKVLEFYADW